MSRDLAFPGILAGVKRPGRWLARQFTRGRHGERALPGLGAPPERVPAHWEPLPDGSVDDVRRKYGRHARTQPRREPVVGSFPALAGADAEADRVAYVRSQMRETVARNDPETIRQALEALRADAPVHGEAPQLAVEQAQRQAEAMLP